MSSTSDDDGVEAYRRLASAYAFACDRNDGPALLALFAPGGELVGPRSTRTGDKIAEVPALLAGNFVRTRHEVLNQISTLTAENRLKGETYCTAQHLLRPEVETDMLLIWSVRYEDELVRVKNIWLLAKRTVHVDWQEKRRVLSR